MHSFKRMVMTGVSVLLLVVLLSAVFFQGFFHSQLYFYQDSKVLDDLAGNLDTLVTGSSNALMAFDTGVLDEDLDCSSYNLSGTLMTLRAKKFLLEHEIARNPIQTVVLDVSYETLSRNESAERAEGDAKSITRLSSAKDRFAFIKECIRFEDYLSLYAQLFSSSVDYWVNWIYGNPTCTVEPEMKGFKGYGATDVTLSSSDAPELYNSNAVNTNYFQENVETMTSIIEMCQAKGIQVILVTVPRSDAELWKFDGLDQYYSYMTAFAEENDCAFYDMNLVKNRYELLDDRTSYHDENHLSAEGAAAFTEAFCDIVKKAETEDVSDCFYGSYEEMRAESPYMEYLK